MLITEEIQQGQLLILAKCTAFSFFLTHYFSKKEHVC